LIFGGYLNMAACTVAGTTSMTMQSLFTNTMRTPATAADIKTMHVKDNVCRESTFGKRTSKHNFIPREKGVRYGQAGMNAATTVETNPKVIDAANATASP
jgi:hypothetical protein